MPISTRGATSLNQAGLATITLNKPAGVVAGDVLIAGIQVANGTTHATSPGWTEIGWKADPNNLTTTTVLRLVAGGAEPATYVFTGAAAQTINGFVLPKVGVDNVTPEDAAATVNIGSGVTLTAPSITTVTDGAEWVVVLVTDGNATTISLPAGFTNDVVTFGSGGDLMRVDHKVIAAHGATGTVTATQDDAAAGDWWVTISLALRPAASASGPTPAPRPQLWALPLQSLLKLRGPGALLLARRWLAQLNRFRPAFNAATATTWDLAGVGASTSAGSGALGGVLAIAGSGASSSSGAGALTGISALAGTGASSSTGAGALLLTMAIAGAGASTSSGSGALIQTWQIAGSGASSSSGSGALTAMRSLAGVGASSSSGSGALSLRLAIGGAGASTSSGSGVLAMVMAIAASGASTSTGSGAINIAGATTTWALNATGASTSSGSGALALYRALAASGASASAGSGAITVYRGLAAVGASSSAGVGAFTLNVGLTAAGASSSAGAGALVVRIGLQASGGSTSSGAADLGDIVKWTIFSNVTANESHDVVATVEPQLGVTSPGAGPGPVVETRAGAVVSSVSGVKVSSTVSG